MSRHRRERQQRRRNQPDGLPNYAPAVMALGQQGLSDGTIKPGQVYTIDVRHDDWCDLLAGRGSCNCDPDVGLPCRVPSSQEN
jgi:hypothetical protein